MNELLMEKTKVVAYLLWEKTQHDHALHHWYCAEDIACFFEACSLFDAGAVERILQNGVYDLGYIEFVRHIAYRIYVYTNETDACFNWYAAEGLLKDKEWCSCLVAMSNIYNAEKDNSDFIKAIRSDKVRHFYTNPL